MEAYELLTGVGELFIAPAGEAKPALSATPGVNWVSLGVTDGGVKIIKTQSIEKHRVDQRVGIVKAHRTEEGQTVETSLAQATLENFANVVGGDVTDTAAGVGTIGYRTVKNYKGKVVEEFALLFRGDSPYGANFVGQYYVPRGFMDDDVETEYVKDGKTLIPVKFEAMEDLDAVNAEDRFGQYDYQDAAALS